MRIVLVPSGLSWLDSEIGGFPAAGVVAASGQAGCGKTSLALGYTLMSLNKGPTCFLTNDTPEALLETSCDVFEHDLRPHVASRRLTVLSFARFFSTKVRSRHSVDKPLAELAQLVVERRIEHLVFDTFDPMLSWVEPANARALARSVMATLQSWGISVLCTMSGTAPSALEFVRAASGHLELVRGGLRLHHAGWCNVRGRSAALHHVQGRGLVVRTPSPTTGQGPSEAPQSWTSLITDSMRKLGVDEQEWTELWDDIVGDDIGGPRSSHPVLDVEGTDDANRAPASLAHGALASELHDGHGDGSEPSAARLGE